MLRSKIYKNPQIEINPFGVEFLIIKPINLNDFIHLNQWYNCGTLSAHRHFLPKFLSSFLNS